jgi:hypothetical protein
MDMIEAVWVKCMIECKIQDTFTEAFRNFDVASLRVAVNIGDTSINNYSNGIGIHVDSDE